MYNLSLPIYVLFYWRVWTNCAERVLSTVSSLRVCLLLLFVLYCTMPFIATCVDAIGTVFWDRPSKKLRILHNICTFTKKEKNWHNILGCIFIFMFVRNNRRYLKCSNLVIYVRAVMFQATEVQFFK